MSADRSLVQAAEVSARKTWSTPVVIVESASDQTLSTYNVLGPDATTSGSPVGS